MRRASKALIGLEATSLTGVEATLMSACRVSARPWKVMDAIESLHGKSCTIDTKDEKQQQNVVDRNRSVPNLNVVNIVKVRLDEYKLLSQLLKGRCLDVAAAQPPFRPTQPPCLFLVCPTLV